MYINKWNKSVNYIDNDGGSGNVLSIPCSHETYNYTMIIAIIIQGIR